MNTFSIRDLKPNSYFTKPLLLDSRFVLLSPEMPFTQEMLKGLMEWDFRQVISEGEPVDHYGEGEQGGQISIPEAAIPLMGLEDERFKEAYVFYHQFLEWTEALFTKFVTKNEINEKEVSEHIKALCDVIKEDRRFLLRIKNPNNDDRNYLAAHTVRSTIFSVILGTYLKLPNHRLIELGTAALLHEIGMVRLPPQLYMTNNPLSPQERKAILTHPILGYNILRGFSFPLGVCLGALEHHEKINGQGYPRRLTGEKISLNAKIIAVACSYDAITAERPFKTARDGYTGMIDLLKNVGQSYDDVIVRALVYSLSIYPIGLYVLLTNDRKGMVVDVNPENPRHPVVQVFGDKTPDGKDRLIQTSAEGVQIVRPLTQAEVGGLTPGNPS